MMSSSESSRRRWWRRGSKNSDTHGQTEALPSDAAGQPAADNQISTSAAIAQSVTADGNPVIALPSADGSDKRPCDKLSLPEGIQGRRRMPVDAVTSGFVQWLIEQGYTGEQARPDVLNLLAEFCELKGWSQPAENFFLSRLKRICGGKHDRRVKMPDGKVKRVSTYDIPAMIAIERAADDHGRRVA